MSIVPPSVLCRILVKEEEFVDRLIIIIRGSIQKIKFGTLDNQCIFHLLISILDYPYGSLTSGSVYGSSFLIVPQFATYSLFSLTDGLAVSLSQSDYMSVISLGNEVESDRKDISLFISSLNVEAPMGDALYDMPRKPQTIKQVPTNLIEYAERVEAIRDQYMISAEWYQVSIRVLEALFDNRREQSCASHICKTILEEMKLDGVKLFITKSNEDMEQIVHFYKSLVRCSVWKERTSRSIFGILCKETILFL